MPHDERGAIYSICLPSTARQHATSRLDIKQELFVAGRVPWFESTWPAVRDNCLEIAVRENAWRNEWLRFEFRRDAVEQIGG